MQKVQIYVGSTRLDLFKDETISLTQSLKNVKDVSKIFTEFTQTFSVPASPTNNILFEHYYNFDIVNGFDARVKKSSYIELNYIPFKQGFMRLDGVDLKRNKAYAYRITFFGETVALKDVLGENQLDALDLAAYNKTYDYTSIRDLMNVDTTTNDVVVPMITHSSPVFFDSSAVTAGTNNMKFQASSGAGVLWSELKYALRISKIVDQIETDYLTELGLSFSDDFFNDTNADYYNLFMWLHRKSGDVDSASGSGNEYNLLINSFVPDPLLPTNVNTLSSQTSLIISSTNPTDNVVNYYSFQAVPTDNTKQYLLTITRNGEVWYSSGYVTGSIYVDQTTAGAMNPATYNFNLTAVEQVSFSALDLSVGGSYTSSGSTVNYDDFWEGVTGADVPIPNSFPFAINEQIPEIKIIDFLSGLFKTFNLVAYHQNDKIVVQTYDDYFASLDTGFWNLQQEEWQDEVRFWNEIGSATTNVYSIDEFMDVNSSQVNVALPYKQINFSYEGTGTFLAKKYNQLNNVGWGELRYTLNGEVYDAPSETYSVKLPFEHMLFDRINNLNGGSQTNIMYGYSVNENQEPYIGKPLIFYPVRQSQLTLVSVRENSTNNDSLSSLILPSNSVSLYSNISTSNINFNEEVNEFSQATGFSNTLFEGYYKNFISESFNIKRRFIKVKAFLPLNILYNLKLNNVIEINNQNYKINSMTTNFQTGETSFELINIL